MYSLTGFDKWIHPCTSTTTIEIQNISIILKCSLCLFPANPHTYPLLRAISNLLPIILYKLNHTICILWCLASYVFYCEVSIKVFALFCFVTEFLEFFIHLDASLKLATHLLQIDCLFVFKGTGSCSAAQAGVQCVSTGTKPRDRHGSFDLLHFRPGPIHPSLGNLVVPSSQGTSSQGCHADTPST